MNKGLCNVSFPCTTGQECPAYSGFVTGNHEEDFFVNGLFV